MTAMALMELLSAIINRAVRVLQILSDRLVSTGIVRYLVDKGLLTPNGLTTSRIVFAAGQVAGFWYCYRFLGSLTHLRQIKWDLFSVFLIGALTDVFDGAIARVYKNRFSEETKNFGRNFDRHVDKIFTTTQMLGYLWFYNVRIQIITIVIILGDLLATILAVHIAKIKQAVGSNSLGKIKMTTQCISIGCMILGLNEVFLESMLVTSLMSGASSLVVNYRKNRPGVLVIAKDRAEGLV